jgi:predicted amidohydrolase YtcJ
MLLNSTVITVDSQDSIAQAVAIKDRLIQPVGSIRVAYTMIGGKIVYQA